MKPYLKKVEYSQENMQISFIFSDGYKFTKDVPNNCHISLKNDDIPDEYNTIKKHFVLFLEDLPNLQNYSNMNGTWLNTIFFEQSPLHIIKEKQIGLS
ncbi:MULTISPECIES: hypothetical protein [unclassified Francisella]|uniref:hypothetical protein n=1 Tax=unclassified Francisella TaxID=2610885 RepID=UPI002E35B59F|nr:MULTISPECIES: hypothetical protein [unclassified Francisella]MED7819693.1 hypothetical protein [Francisella sp. 19S2-4]MED7830542.1 hypothetical protein [Francisella sp. 19S2-10]